jgi:hypothetical protein
MEKNDIELRELRHKYRTLSAAFNRLKRDHTQLEWDHIILQNNFQIISKLKADEWTSMLLNTINTHNENNRIHW